MKYRTFKFWSDNGYKILKGSHHRKRTKAGTPLFGEDQVEEYYSHYAPDDLDMTFGFWEFWKND